MQTPPMIVSDKSITVYLNGETLTVRQDHPNFTKIKNRIKSCKFGNLKQLFNIETALKASGFQQKGQKFFWRGKEIKNYVTQKINELLASGFSIRPLVSFLKNTYKNPSPESIEDLYRFLEHNNLPITSDGCFLAFKRVNENYTDFHTSQNCNKVGKTIKMNRALVVFDKNQTCSQGLHVASRAYLDYFHKGAGHVMVVKVDPQNVVSVPTDYNDTKMRVCEYKVISEVEEPQIDNLKNYGLHRPVYRQTNKVSYNRDRLGRFASKS